MKRREVIEAVKKIIIRNCAPERIYLFGSSIDTMVDAPGDIDIAYDCKEKDQLYLIKEEINQLSTLIKIDIVNIAKADERFRNRVKETGKVIWSATKLLRFEDALLNLNNAYTKFIDVIDKKEQYIEDGYGDVFLDIAVKRFEFTFEMAWKACKRSLDYLGFSCMSPRDCLKEAFAQQLITDEKIWLEMLEQRNLSAHIYNEINIREIKYDLENYASQIKLLIDKLEQLFTKETE